MIGLIIWAFIAVIVMGGVSMLFTATSKQTAIGAEQGQQQQSILNALNRVSRDVTMSNPIVYASSTDIVLDVDVTTDPAHPVVERRWYSLNTTDQKVYEYSKVLKVRGASYDHAKASDINYTDDGTYQDYWEDPNVQRKAATVSKVDVSNLSVMPFLKYYGSNGAPLSSAPRSSSADTEGIARVDIAVTAGVADKGNVSLSTSAVPRSTINLGATATSVLATCPAFTATLEGETVTLRWDKSDGASSYEVSRNGVKLDSIADSATTLKYSYVDNPGSSGTVLNYMLKVISPAGISNCTDSIRPIVVMPGATQLTNDLIPATTVDGSGVPVSTAWSNAGETTQVNVQWQKVGIASGYILYKQPLDNTGNPIGERVVVANLDTYPYIDQNSTTLAPNNLSYKVNVGWDEQWAWTIKVLSRSGDNDQTPEVRTLSYPAPVTDASIRALPVSGSSSDKVSVDDLTKGFGNTKITWNYTAGPEARGFDIYRSAIDAPADNFPAGFSKIASVDPGVNEYIDRTAELGSTYGYYVVAKNKSGFANSYASQRVQQLQFPADPNVTPVGANGSRDLANSTNQMMWSLTKSATGYQVERAPFGQTQTTCMTNSDCSQTTGSLGASATSYIDTSSDIKPATRFIYYVYSYNATGLSPKLAAYTALTQRPSAPTLKLGSIPTLQTTVTNMQWDHTAGSWCAPGTYTGASGSNACEYQQVQYDNANNVRYIDVAYALGYNWNNQGWGRHYSYGVYARNAAITNSGWSDEATKVSSDTYPADFGINAWNGDNNANYAQRILYGSSVGNGGWGDVSQAGYTTAGIGNAVGSREVSVVRVHDGWQVTSGDSSLLLPPWDNPGGVFTGGNGQVNSAVWTLIASPGTTYRYDFVAKSIENELTRSKSGSNIVTPADIPRAGAVQTVCSGPGNGDSTGMQNWPNQIISARTAYSDYRSRYGYYENTVVQKLHGNGPSDYWGVGWATVGTSGNGDNILATDGIGYYHNITDGFNFTNIASGRTDSATLRGFTNSAILTFDGCSASGQPMIEPADACYVSTYAGCAALNPDQRPKWLSR